MLGLKLEGIDKAIQQFEKANKVVYQRSNHQVDLSTLRIANGAKLLVAVDKGLLKKSIAAIMRGSSGYVGIRGGGGARGRGGAGPERYWYYIEFGTKHAAARPFFRPAAESDKGRFVSGMTSIGVEIEQGV